MKGNVHSQLERIETKLRKKYRAVLELPPGVPEPLRLKVLKQQYKEIRREWNDPEEREMRQLFPDTVLHITGCAASCPDCEMLPWCKLGREILLEEAGDFDGLDEDDDEDDGESEDEDEDDPEVGYGFADDPEGGGENGFLVEEIAEDSEWARKLGVVPEEEPSGGKLYHVRIPLPRWLRG
ncbi:MAG: hypothetical protein KA419_00710 [Acidobacteria bacterium]|nr:hypothetical protein [Acidobacteriota bacterium]